jgi:putative ABC transport system permease protein
MRIPLLRGRDFTGHDTQTSQLVTIINSTLARIYFSGADPLGQRISFDPPQQWLTIVGITGDIHEDGLISAVAPQAYTPYSQQAGPLLNGGTLIVRTSVDPGSLAGAVRTVIREVNPQAAPAIRTMDAVLARSLSKQRFQMEVLGAFAILGLVLAAVGLYGVVSYIVTANRTQIGIRLALGASRARVFRMVVGHALKLTFIGVAAGAFGCLALRRVLSSVIFGIGANDPFTLAIAIAVIVGAALAATLIPARRATKIDPMVALRSE